MIGYKPLYYPLNSKKIDSLAGKWDSCRCDSYEFDDVSLDTYYCFWCDKFSKSYMYRFI